MNPETPPRLAPVGRALGSLAYRQTLLFKDQGARLDAAIRERFAGTFAESNARLQRFSPCDLRALGYEMPADDL